MKKYGSLFIKVLISISLFYILLSGIDRTSILKTISLMDIAFVPLILFLITLNYVVSSIRWKYLLLGKQSKDVSIKYLTSLYFIGSFFNNFMPTSMGGDVFKIYALGKKIKDTAIAFSATFMERFTGMIVLVLISYFGFVKTLPFWISQLPDSISSNAGLTLTFEVLLFGGFWVVSLLAFLSLSFLAKKVKLAKKVYDSLLVYKQDKKVLIIAFLTSIGVQAISILTQYLIFSSLGVDLYFWNAVFIFPVITLAGFFVPSLNGFGVQDALYVQFFGMAGVSTELAISASIIYHLARLFISLIGGVLYAMGKDK
jgi:hypothetical protein